MTKLARIQLPLLASTLLMLLAQSALAQSAEKRYRFEFFGGASYPLQKTFVIGSPQSDVPIDGKQTFSVGAMGGVRFGIDGRRYWGQDYTYSYGQNATRLETDFGRFSFTNHVHQANTSILFYPWSLERHKFFPYITGGIGATWITVSQRTITESVNPFQGGFGPLKTEVVAAFHAGFGTRIRLSERFGLRLDVRDYMSRALHYGLPESSSDPTHAVLPTEGVFHQLTATIGLIVHF